MKLKDCADANIESARTCVSDGKVFIGTAGIETVCCKLHGAMNNHGTTKSGVAYRCSEKGCGNCAYLI